LEDKMERSAKGIFIGLITILMLFAILGESLVKIV